MALKFLFTMQITIDRRNNKPARINYAEWNKLWTQRLYLSGFRNEILQLCPMLNNGNLIKGYSAPFYFLNA